MTRSRTLRWLPWILLALWGGLWLRGRSLPELDPVVIQEIRSELEAQVLAHLESRSLERDDGYAYAVDLGQLLIYAARSYRSDLFARLRGILVERFLVRDPEQDFSRGMVAWRRHPTEPPDASGTTEALRVAQGLWEGFHAFGDTADRELALEILDAYARHATVDADLWLVRNYYNLGTRSFAPNSFLVDYAPDFIAEVAEATDRDSLRDLARRSADLIDGASTPAGLLYDIVQPEVRTLMPASGSPIFSPNDIVQLSNAATVAEQCVDSNPGEARRVLAFALALEGRPRLAYLGRSGEPAPGVTRSGLETSAALTRLSIRLSDTEGIERFGARLLSDAAELARSESDPFLYAASEALLTLELLAQLEFEAP